MCLSRLLQTATQLMYKTVFVALFIYVFKGIALDYPATEFYT